LETNLLAFGIYGVYFDYAMGHHFWEAI
jgi:hypothetical protein